MDDVGHLNETYLVGHLNETYLVGHLNETYLGGGMYASFDGQIIRLRIPQLEGGYFAALISQEVYHKLIKFVHTNIPAKWYT